MTVTIKGRIFPLSFDAAEDAAPVWTWTGVVPLCPRHLEQWGKAAPLLTHGHEDSARVTVVDVSPERYAVRCDGCGWQSGEFS